MKKKELILKVAERADISVSDAEKLLEAFVEVIYDGVKNGEKVHILRFGTFDTKIRAERELKLPSNGKIKKLSATRVPVFRPAKAFKDSLRGYIEVVRK